MSKVTKTELGSLIEFQRGFDLPKSQFVKGKYPVQSSNGVLGYHNEYKVVAPGITIGRSGTVGTPHLIKENFYPHNTALFIKDFKGNNVEYIYYLLKSLKLNNRKSGSGVPTMNRNHLHPLKILAHINVDKQTQIAKVLSDLDAKIELNNKINVELEAMAKLIYDYWFVQFDFPYDFKQGKVADDSSNPKNVKPYKSSGGKMVYNAELKREIPEGWEVDTLSSWIKNDKSGDWGKESKEGNYTEKVSCIRGADINGLNGKGEVKSPTRFILEKNSHKMLEIGDFIIEISGGSPTQSTGRIAFIIKESLERFEDPLICSNFCKAVTLKDEKSIFNFSYLWQRLYDAGVLFGWEGKTSGIKNFLFESFVSKHKDLIPPKELMESFYNKIYPIHAKIQTNLKQNQELASLRDWLLPMLMNGQVTVGSVSREQEVYANEFEAGVAAEGGEEYEKKTTLNIPENKKGFAKLVLAGKIIKECKDSQEFTNIKFQKLQHLAEHLMEANLKLNYYNQVAGPYDNRFMHTLHNKMRQLKWFNSQGYKYSPLEKVNQIDGYFNNYFGSKEKQFSKIISLLGKASEDQCEIVSTLYAVWNDRIIKGEPIEDQLLINDFLDWSERKKKYTVKQIQEAIQWMKDKELEPKGFGELIKQTKKK